MGESRTLTCACGVTVVSSDARRKYCSVKCREVYRKQRVATCKLCAVQFSHFQGDRGQAFCSYSCSAASRAAPRSHLRWLQCRECEQWFVSRNGTRYCGDRCRGVHNIDKALGAYRLAATSRDIRGGMGWFRRIVGYLADRDGNSCAICHGSIDLDLPSGPRGNPLGPSIDHLVPRSQGGPEELANVRLTHWTCNQRRGNRGGNEQLRLIG